MSSSPEARICMSALALSILGSGAAAADDVDKSVLEEIVVTASKREENLQAVAVPVTVQSGQQLMDAGYTGLAEYANNVPSFSISSYGTPGQSQVVVRGISSTGSIATVGTYVDDAPMGGSNGWVNAATTLLDMVPYDLERIELLRGPQGTLYGQGAMGGIVKYVLKKPSSDKFEARVGADLSAIEDSSDVGYTVRGRVSTPVVEGKLGISVAGFYKDTPGYMDNRWTGEKDTNKASQYGGRLAAYWTPTSDLSVNFTALHQSIDADDSNNRQFAGYTVSTNTTGPLLLTPTNPLPNSVQDVAILQSYEQALDFLSATVDWQVGGFDFVSATSYMDSDSTNIWDATQWFGSGFDVPTLAFSKTDYGVEKFTQEFRLASPQGDRLEWLAGLFYTHEEGSNIQSLNLLDDNYQPIPPGAKELYWASIPSKLDEYAAFGNLKWRVSDALNVTVGARVARNEQSFEDFIEPPGVYGLPSYATAELNEDVFNWLGSVDYTVTDGTMVYLRAASGYRPGGTQAVAFAPSYDSDSLVNYEIGLKTTFLDGRARVNLAAYRIDWKDIQLTAYTPDFVGYTVNGGEAVSQGFEIESEFVPIDGLTLGLNAGYTDSHLTSTVPGADYLMTDYQLPFAPKVTAAITAEYDWPISSSWTASVGGAYRYTGEQYLSLVQDAASSFSWMPSVEAPSHSILDMHAAVRNGQWTVSLIANNLANTRKISGASYLNNDNYVTGTQQLNITDLRPRSITLGVDYAF